MSLMSHCSDSVYPRWRGEHEAVVTVDYLHAGLSPLARGTRNNAVRRFLTDRFIPAGAGNTPRWFRIAMDIAVYPRWRGEHNVPAILGNGLRGLSPQARGTP